jgi:hypothetical protein
MIDPNRHIRAKFRVKGFECLPYTGWLMSNRTHLAELFFELDYKVGAEIGVCVGINAETLFQKNPRLKLFCIDPWSPFPEGRTSQHRQDQRFRRTRSRLRQYNAVYIKKTSMEALVDIPDSSLDFVYIDGVHTFDYVMQDIIEWSKKVRSGGIVSGHDYIHLHDCGVIPAVRAYTEGHNITNWYITGGDPFIMPPSFFWVKP